jgi:hypothetical protein
MVATALQIFGEFVKNGDKWWCILPSIESLDYNNDEPKKPWLGILDFVKNPGGMVVYIRRFDKKTNEIDYDQNASSIAKESDLFPTQEQAKQAYLAAMLDYQISKIDALYDGMKNLRDFMENV